MSSFTVSACAFGKESGTTSASAIRVIVPQVAVLQILDSLLSIKLDSFLSTCFKPCSMVWEGARPRTQMMDIVSGLTLLVEKSLDLESQGAIAQEDVKQHYDTIHLVRIYNWLVSQGMSSVLAATFLRHQLLPSIQIFIFGSKATIRNRCRGGLTGSRLAGQLGRIPVRATIDMLLPSFRKFAWSHEGVTLAVASFVDNLFFVAPTAWKATRMGDLFAESLLLHWDQEIKPTSRQVLPVFGAEVTDVTSESWEMVSCMQVLGHAIDNRGSIDRDFRMTQIKMWRAFWANAGRLTSRRIPIKLKFLLLQRTTRSVADQHMVRWPFTIEKASAVDRMQRRMLLNCIGIDRNVGEDLQELWARRKVIVRSWQEQLGPWSIRWAIQMVKWYGHIKRDPNRSWPAQLLSIRDAATLQQRRWLWRRPRTRRLSGFTSTRWCESIAVACSHAGIMASE